jgi:hypothetical protein
MDNILQVLLLHTTDYHNTLPLQNKNKNNKYIKNKEVINIKDGICGI